MKSYIRNIRLFVQPLSGGLIVWIVVWSPLSRTSLSSIVKWTSSSDWKFFIILIFMLAVVCPGSNAAIPIKEMTWVAYSEKQYSTSIDKDNFCIDDQIKNIDCSLKITSLFKYVIVHLLEKFMKK